jgi:uncharacterized phage protein (TIGR01671 family)
MREYRFRGKRVDNGEWVFGDLIQVETDCYIWDYDVMDNGVSESLRAYEIWQKVNPATVGQYTGLHDKNGREIWEGDYLRNYQGDIHEVIWGPRINATLRKKVSHHWPTQYLDCTFMEWEVIGNRWDNPDLLSKEA